MKRLVTIAAYLMVLVLAGVSSLKSAEPGRILGKPPSELSKGKRPSLLAESRGN
jgi:hypothetical protein